MKRNVLFLITIVIALSVLGSASWAVPPLKIEVIGNYFNPRPGSTTLCAKVCPAQAGIWVGFTGETPYGTMVRAWPTRTNAQGIACINTVWPQGIYGVRAWVLTAGPQPPPSDSVQTNGPKPSLIAAVSVFNPKNFCGAQGGGALYLHSYGVPPNVRTTLTDRKATYAFIYKKDDPGYFSVGLLDYSNPCGPVEFVTTQWFDASIQEFAGPDYKSIVVVGMGHAMIGPWDGPVHYRMYADDFPGGSRFRVQLWGINGALLYQSAPDDASSEQKVYEGKNVIQPCP